MFGIVQPKHALTFTSKPTQEAQFHWNFFHVLKMVLTISGRNWNNFNAHFAL